MVRMWMFVVAVTLAGCQCSHLIGTNAVDGGGGSCGTEVWDGGGIVCPYGDLIALQNQPCAVAGQTCKSVACMQDVCSAGCFEGVCDPVTHAWKGTRPPAQGTTACAPDAGRCKYPTECQSQIAASCAFGTGATTAPSCVHQQCVEECPGSRRCDPTSTDAGVCLACGGQPFDCPTRCGISQPGTVTLGDIHCLSGFDAGVFAGQTGWQSTTSCEYPLGSLGTMTHLASGNSLAEFPALGGTCIGRNLFTGVPRTQWYCPACTFVMEGWD